MGKFESIPGVLQERLVENFPLEDTKRRCPVPGAEVALLPLDLQSDAEAEGAK